MGTAPTHSDVFVLGHHVVEEPPPRQGHDAHGHLGVPGVHFGHRPVDPVTTTAGRRVTFIIITIISNNNNSLFKGPQSQDTTLVR